ITLTAQLLTFSRKQMLQPRVLNLGQLVGGMEEMLRRLLGEDIEVRAEQGPGLWNVRADPARIEQVIMNLAVNSRDAMPDGGTLRVATVNSHVDPDSSRQRPPMKAGDYVLLSVSDTGLGMDAATMERIFEPFFTTKERGKGTGLGLATAYGIIKQSEGYIFCTSEKGKGTTFDIYLPRSLDPHDERVSLTPPAVEPGRRSETILLSEDDEGVRRLMTSILERAGYSVVSAGSGAEALAALDELPGGIALLVTDVLMPGLNGKEVARRVRARHPGVRVMFVSGYTEDANVRQVAPEEGVDFLQKPFKSADLLARVRRLLDAAQRASRGDGTQE
ncbi:MAG TPA: response regulator, partial [Spirochaetia bacterium]|nr:response regulator [Spirochaetia bacterium]